MLLCLLIKTIKPNTAFIGLSRGHFVYIWASNNLDMEELWIFL